MKSTQYAVEDLPAHMQSKTEIQPSGCWVWTGAKNSQGYGCVWSQNASRLVHRITYELMVQPIPEGLHIDHLCRVRDCHNPAHLEPVTQHENDLRKPSVHKDHCKHGHPMTAENTMVKRRGNSVMRNCRECERQAQRRRRAAKAQVSINHHEGDKA